MRIQISSTVDINALEHEHVASRHDNAVLHAAQHVL